MSAVKSNKASNMIMTIENPPVDRFLFGDVSFRGSG